MQQKGPADETAGDCCSSDDDMEARKKRARYLIRRMPDPEGEPVGVGVLKRSAYPSAVWWRNPLVNSLAARFEGVALRRSLVIDSICTGLGSEFSALRALGIPIPKAVATDTSEASKMFALKNFGSDIDRFASSIHEYTEYIQANPDRARPNVLIGGPACQPFTQQRSNRTVVPDFAQCRFENTMGMDGPLGSFWACLHTARPRIAVLEQVNGFIAMYWRKVAVRLRRVPGTTREASHGCLGSHLAAAPLDRGLSRRLQVVAWHPSATSLRRDDGG